MNESLTGGNVTSRPDEWRLGKPLLLRSDLTGRVYIVTAYKVIEPGTTGHDVIEAITKVDVSDQFDDLVRGLRGHEQRDPGPIELADPFAPSGRAPEEENRG